MLLRACMQCNRTGYQPFAEAQTLRFDIRSTGDIYYTLRTGSTCFAQPAAALLLCCIRACRQCNRTGYQPFAKARTLRFDIRSNTQSDDPFASSTPRGRLPSLKLFMMNVSGRLPDVTS
jgi:hypothetical protein